MRCIPITRALPLAILAFVLAAAVPLAPILAQDVMYRWTDEQGVVHYGQVPPSGVDAQRITTAAPRGDGAPQQRLERAMGDMEQRQDQARSEQEERERREASERIRAENCERARRNLETLTERGGRVTIRENDQYRVLDEDERQARIDETRAHIQEFCRD
ncbi:DUF4124 domain-containing protein [Thioalkalivibrio denitrificans]|uniref:DUF4124 domain-containing protein n=1 Tax=Thioalkalivibrio denitrificans TaxID=108003 RepID=A0A1V3NKX7_9GAMM|nr:DUF4124 domain-containing protein [Thioalkalivibrio denitrificans]OOG25593.1 DUF4124 domain-containing protein [Thioalkalivibrio denitrificans]